MRLDANVQSIRICTSPLVVSIPPFYWYRSAVSVPMAYICIVLVESQVVMSEHISYPNEEITEDSRCMNFMGLDEVHSCLSTKLSPGLSAYLENVKLVGGVGDCHFSILNEGVSFSCIHKLDC